MNTHIKLSLSMILLSCLCAPTALAQSSHYASDAALFGSSDPFEHVGLNAGLNLTIPLGAKPKKHDINKARVSFKLSLSHPETYGPVTHGFKLNGDIFEIGMNFDGTPNLLMNGQDLYSPLFGPLYADEDGAKDKGGTDNETDPTHSQEAPGAGGAGGALLIAGGLVALGTVVLVSEAADDISDCFIVFSSNTDPKCN